MRLLTRAFMLVLFLLPAQLVAVTSNLTDEDDAPFFMMHDIPDGYASFYGIYPHVQTYELEGSADDEFMDTVKMKRNAGYGIGASVGFWLSSDISLEVDFQYLNQVEKMSVVVSDVGTDGKKRTGHVSKLETRAWKVTLLSKYYLSSALDAALEGKNPWNNEEEEDDDGDEMEERFLIFAPYIETGVSLSHDTINVREAATKTDNVSWGAKLDTTDRANLRKFEDSDFLFSWQVGMGLDVVINGLITSVGYRMDLDFQNPVFEQTEGAAYKLTLDRNKTHNILLGVKFAF